jgi:hypothetical protein
MADALIVLLLLAGSDAKDDATAPAMTAAARRALGPDAVVLVDERPEVPADADALTLGARLHARGVVEVTWSDAGHRTARVHVHVAERPERLDRELRFAPEDSPAERGRTIGLALATMITERAAPEEPPPTPAPAPAPAPAPDVAQRAPAPDVRRVGIDLLGIGGVGLGGEAAGAGGALGARWYATEGIAARAAAAARFGSLPAADASAYAIMFAGGAAVRLIDAGDLAISVRGDVLLMRFAVRRDALEHSRWIAGADVVLEGAARVADGTYLLGGVGYEVVFGPTDVGVGGAPTTRVPIARLVAELGLRRRF